MKILKNNIKNQERNNQDLFFLLLKNLRIEQAIKEFLSDYVEINYNRKQRCISKETWLKYLRKTILNKSTEVVQFKIEKILNDNASYKIFMICKKSKGTLDLTEINVSNFWDDNQINRMQYKLVNY